MACAIRGRYLLLEAAIKGPKFGLGDAPINQRPSGGGHGFPSGHTAATSFGATALVMGCLRDSPGAQALAVLSAGFVGGSRIDADLTGRTARDRPGYARDQASVGSIAWQASTSPRTAATELSNISCSALSSRMSTIRSMPAAPMMVGTPTYIPLSP